LPDALRREGRHAFTLDLAFVAMERNLDQLPQVAALARERWVPALAVHPVIRRAEILERFAAELDEQGRLRDGFRTRLAGAVAAIRDAHPGLTVVVSTPELSESAARLGADPTYWTSAPPSGARILDCDQGPWEPSTSWLMEPRWSTRCATGF
jgi:hypothetical protein